MRRSFVVAVVITVSFVILRPAGTAAAEDVAPPANATAAPSALPAPKDKVIPCYFRVDQDYLFGLQLWAGASFPLSNRVAIAADIYMPEAAGPAVSTASFSYWSELDLGPVFTFGPLSINPMAGIAFDWGARRAVALDVPQLYTIVNLSRVYVESWIWTVLYSAFPDKVWNDYFYTRNFVLYKLNETIAVGPQFEYMYYFQDYVITDASGASVVVNARGTAAAPLGGHVELTLGAGNSIGVFIGYELAKKVRTANGDNAIEGRLTFVHNL